MHYALISGCLAYCLTSVKGQYNTQELDDVCYIVTVINNLYLHTIPQAVSYMRFSLTLISSSICFFSRILEDRLASPRLQSLSVLGFELRSF